ncbi:MAG: VCBS repeat-containing protein [Phycisphaerales bacterium]|nr:VCBS repeat-containing protein [Phycisphaerales bacterium]
MGSVKHNRLSPAQIFAVFGAGVPICGVARAQIEFSELLHLPTPLPVSGVAPTDLNGDGITDIVTCETLESVRYFRGLRNGGFVLAGSLYEPGATLRDIQAIDLNGDGNIDLAWTQRTGGAYQITIFYNAGDGRSGWFGSVPIGSKPPGAVAFGDVTEDPLPDLVVVGGFRFLSDTCDVRIYANQQGAFVLSQTQFLNDNAGQDVAIGDIDDDGDADVCVLTADLEVNDYNRWKIYHSEIGILLNDGEGVFTPGLYLELPYGQGGSYDPMPHSVAQADIDGDGDLDMAVSASSLNDSSDVLLQVIESVDSGRDFRLLTPLVLDINRGESTLQAGDLDVDGDIDLLMNISGRNLWICENTGEGEFLVTSAGVTELRPPGPVLGDFNDDGLIDWVAPEYPGCAVYLNETAYAGPTIEHTALKRGARSTLTASGVLPLENVRFLYSMRGFGSTVGIRQLGGITLDMNEPIQMLGSAVADANGVAEFHFTVPPNAPLAEVVLQAVIRRRPGGADSVKTPFRTARITD